MRTQCLQTRFFPQEISFDLFHSVYACKSGSLDCIRRYGHTGNIDTIVTEVGFEGLILL